MLGVSRYTPSLSEDDNEQRRLAGLLLGPGHIEPSTPWEGDLVPKLSSTQDIRNPRVPYEQGANVNSTSWAIPLQSPRGHKGPPGASHILNIGWVSGAPKSFFLLDPVPIDQEES